MPKLHLYLVSYDDTKTPLQGLRVHWALLLAPPPGREDPGTLVRCAARYHATRRGGRWAFERRAVECVRSPAMLGRVRVATVDARGGADVDRVLCGVRVRGRDEGEGGDGGGDEDWDCRSWVEDALRALEKQGAVDFRRVFRMEDLFAFAQRFSEKVVESGLNVGYGIPPTINYPGPRL